MKKALSFALVLALVLGCLGVTAFAANDIAVTINDKPVTWTDAKPFIDENNRVLVPLRAVGEAMGLTVKWDNVNRVAEFSRVTPETETNLGETRILRFPVDSKTATLEIYYAGSEESGPDRTSDIVMDTAAVIVDSRTYAPVRYLAESFDYLVSWDSETQTVEVGYPAYRYSFATQMPTYVNITFDKAENFAQLESVEVKSASVNGEEAVFSIFTDEDLKNIQADFSPNTFYAFTIEHAFEEDKDYSIQWTVLETLADGSAAEFTYTYDWHCYGYGGW